MNNIQPTIKDAEPTIGDVLEAINNFATKTEKRFQTIETNMVTKQDLKQELEGFATKEDLKNQLAETETRLVTKSYLDAKLADQASEYGDRINRKHELDKAWKTTARQILQQNKLGTTEQLELLDEYTV